MSFETNSLRLDVYFKKKQANSNIKKLDRRNIRQKISQEDMLKKRLTLTLLKLGINKPGLVVLELLKIKNIDNLNIELVSIVYLYFVKKNLDIDLIVSDFDNDFNDQLKIVKEKNIFPKLVTDYKIYLFRQDFIMYLILIADDEEENSANTYEDIEEYRDDPDSYEEENSYY